MVKTIIGVLLAFLVATKAGAVCMEYPPCTYGHDAQRTMALNQRTIKAVAMLFEDLLQSPLGYRDTTPVIFGLIHSAPADAGPLLPLRVISEWVLQQSFDTGKRWVLLRVVENALEHLSEEIERMLKRKHDYLVADGDQLPRYYHEIREINLLLLNDSERGVAQTLYNIEKFAHENSQPGLRARVEQLRVKAVEVAQYTSPQRRSTCANLLGTIWRVLNKQVVLK